MGLRKTVTELQQTPYATRKTVAVDEQDNELGETPLIAAHRDGGIKHRAFSVILYRERTGNKELLLQLRAQEKPVFCLLWANTCCYNMACGEEYLARAATRTNEEMGTTVRSQELRILYRFSYEAQDVEGWCENELDTVIVGKYDDAVSPDPSEVADYRWVEWNALKIDIGKNPDTYAPWFKMIVADQRTEAVFGE